MIDLWKLVIFKNLLLIISYDRYLLRNFITNYDVSRESLRNYEDRRDSVDDA